MKNKEVTERLKEIRTENGYTQAQFAEILDMSYDGYKKMERGSTKISIDKLALLEERLNVSADYILFGQKSDYEDVCVKINMLPENEKFSLMIRLYMYFVKTKKKSFVNIKEEFPLETMLEEMFEQFQEKESLCEEK